MTLRRRYQVSITDLLVMTVLAAAITALVTRKSEAAFIAASGIGAFIWNRPIVSRLWAVGVIGMGAGLYASGSKGNFSIALQLPADSQVAWGAGMAIGGIAYMLMFRLYAAIAEPPDA